MSGFTIVHVRDFERPFPKCALSRRSLGLQSFGSVLIVSAPRTSGYTRPDWA